MNKKVHKPHFAIRIPEDKLNKIKYIAEYNGRSGNREIEMIITKKIDEFEKIHGPIVLD